MSIWQELGAFVVTGSDLSNYHLDRFSRVGGNWFCPIVYGDNNSGPWNLANLRDLQTRAEHFSLKVGAWVNGWGGDPLADAQAIAGIVKSHNLPLVVLDLEAAYQYPVGNPNLMPELVRLVRGLLPTTEIAVTTNELNNSMIWNGRTLHPPLSFHDLGVRVIPQTYSWMYRENAAYRPDNLMTWLKQYGGSDFNFVDLNSLKTHNRGIPLSYVHPVLEVSVIEGSDLNDELHWLARAMEHGFTSGFSIYMLECTPDNDFDTLAKYRNILYRG